MNAAPKIRPEPLRLKVAEVSSALGPMVICGDESAIYLVEFQDRRKLEDQFEGLRRRVGASISPGTSPAIERMGCELAAYFASGLWKFETPVRLSGTAFQKRVWGALRDIPSGQTCAYGEVARKVGSPTAVRAVARAIGQNRLAIVIPCHRVLGANGQLTGYAGGLWRKRSLLAHEQSAG